jgi:uncharacterized membrane protein
MTDKQIKNIYITIRGILFLVIIPFLEFGLSCIFCEPSADLFVIVWTINLFVLAFCLKIVEKINE